MSISVTVDVDVDVDVDVLVIGAGVGGVSAAANLAHHGRRVLLVEAADRIGGRASSGGVDGFILNTGALAIERDGPVADLYGKLGLHLDLDVPRPETVALCGRYTINAVTGPAGLVRTVAPALLRALSRAVPALRPRPGQSTADWLRGFTRNSAVHGLVDNVCGSFFAATGDDLPADVFLHYTSEGSAFKKLGFAPGGTIEVWKPLADYVTSHNGEVWLDSPVTKILVDETGRARGALVRHDGETVRVRADAVVSNVGPAHTVRLAGPVSFPPGYAETVSREADCGSILTVHFASPTPLVSWPAIGLPGRSRRMIYAVNANAPAQRRVLKPGWHLYSAAGTPRPTRGPFDVEHEKALLLDDVRDYFPGFDAHATVLAWDVNDWNNPAQRAITGFDLPNETPVPNLWNVGDGVKPWGDAGTAACVRSADIVVTRILEQIPQGAGTR